MTKKRAYTSPTGSETISAQQVKAYRARYNNQSYPYPLYSTHAPGRRRRVYHSNKGSSFFAYNPDGSGGSAASDGESLNHLLFKEALFGLKHTRLALYEPGKNKNPDFWTNAFIAICPSPEKEKMISPDDESHPLFADIYFTFESEHWLADKWSGEAYVEIFNTHAVEVEKQKVLKRLELPTIEVDIRERPYAYAVDEEDTTDEKEADHVHRLRRMLEHDNGFLKAIVLSNPSSASYLQQRLTEQVEQSRQLKAELDAANSMLQSAAKDKLFVEEALSSLEVDMTELQTGNDKLTVSLQLSSSELSRLTNAHSSLVEDHRALAEKHESVRWSLHARYLLVLVFVAAVFTGMTFLWTTDEPIAAAQATVTPQLAESPQHTSDTQRPRAKAHTRHGSSGH